MVKEYNVIGFYEQKNETSLSKKARLSRYQLKKVLYLLNLR